MSICSVPVIEQDEPRDLAALAVPLVGWLQRVDDPWEPCRLCDPAGVVMEPVAVYLRDLQAAGRPETTLRAYATALLRWLRFCWGVEVPWDEATRSEARDFCRWIQIAGRPERTHWRRAGAGKGDRPPAAAETGTPNPVTGKPAPGRRYAPSTAAHSESVLRGFYEFHREAGTGPMVNPFPLARGWQGGGRAHAHHDPMQPYRNERSGLYRPRLVQQAPRRIPGEVQRAVRRARLSSGPGPGRVLGVHRSAGRGAAGLLWR
jgi:hypothetical protein